MKIGSSYAPSFLITIKEQTFDKLTATQKLIGVVALAALACLPFLFRCAYSFYKEKKFEWLLSEAIEMDLQGNPLDADARYLEALSYGKNENILKKYALFLIKNEKWQEAEQQLVELMALGVAFIDEESVKTHYIDALISQEKFEEAALFLENLRTENAQEFYEDSGWSFDYVYVLYYCQNDAEKTNEFLREALFHHPRDALLLRVRAEVLIQLNRPYEEIAAVIDPVLPDLMRESEEYDTYGKIQLLSKYIELQHQFGRPAQEQITRLRAILRAADEPEDAVELAWQAVAWRVLGNLTLSKEWLQEAVDSDPSDPIIRKEYLITLEAARPFELMAEAKALSARNNVLEADAKFKEALSFGKNLLIMKDYAQFLIDHKKWDDAEVQLKECLDLEPEGILPGMRMRLKIVLLRALLQQGKLDETSLFLESRLNAEQENFYRNDTLCQLYGYILLCQGNAVKANEIFSRPLAHYSSIIKYTPSLLPLLLHQADALILLGRPQEEVLRGLNEFVPDILNADLDSCSYLNAALLAKYIEVQRHFGLPADEALVKLGEIIHNLDDETSVYEITEDPVQGGCLDDIWRAVSLRILGRLDEAKSALEMVLEENDQDIYAKREYELTLRARAII